MQCYGDGTGVSEIVLNATRALVGVAASSFGEVSDDVSLAQYRLLVLLEGRGSPTMGELARTLDVNPSTVTRVCDLLVDKKLIRRRAVKDDRRGVCAELTPRGRTLVEQVMSRRRVLVDDTLELMTEEGRRRLACGLAEFAAAAGEIADHAWTLGWPLEREETGDGDG